MNCERYWRGMVGIILILVLLSSFGAAATLAKKQAIALNTVASQDIRSGDGTLYVKPFEPTIVNTDASKPFVERATNASPDRIKLRDTVLVRQVLKLSEATHVRPLLAKKLIVRKSEDSRSFELIANTTATLLKEDEEKQVFAAEALNMDKRFISKFSRRIQLAAPRQRARMAAQAKALVHAVELKKPVRIRISNSNLENLFSKRRSMDALIEELWSKS